MNKDLADISKHLFGAQQDSELGITGYEGNLLFKTISTPLVRSAMIAVICSVVLLPAFIFAPTDVWTNIIGTIFISIVVLTALFVLVVPLIKPKVAESDIQTMFFIYAGLVRQSMELPTQLDGDSIEDANLKELTQPIQKKLKETVGIKDTLQVRVIKGE